MAKDTDSKFFQSISEDFSPSLFNEIQDGILFYDRSKKVVWVNNAATHLLGRESGDLVGKRCPEDPSFYMDADGNDICRKNCPVEMSLEDGKTRTMFAYLRKKQGYGVPVVLRIVPLTKGNGSISGAVEIVSEASPKTAIPYAPEELEKMNLIDPETGIAGKAYLEMTLSQRLDEFQKYGVPFGLIYADIDNYQKILEKSGRVNAVKIIRTVARTLQKNIRYFDIAGRWDTEEFLVLLLNIDESRLDIVANKLRLLVSESYFTMETKMMNATVSMGASIVQRYDTAESLIKRTEQLMKHSKWLGKNKVSLSFVQKDLA